ncbi:MAG: hypothetical protein JRJ08_05275 [Deltaproteobacteria bacterium]|nr:hypothetical protein [Deltaproteobacteria bacterium]
MAQYKNKIMIILIAGLSFLFMIIGCQKYRVMVGTTHPSYGPSVKEGPPPWAPAHGYRAKYRYFYYPSSYIYFDTGRNLYFYFEGGQWQVSAALPAGIKLNVSDYVTLEMDTDKPYQFHSDVVKKHPPGYLKKAKGKDKDKKKDKGKDKKKWD